MVSYSKGPVQENLFLITWQGMTMHIFCIILEKAYFNFVKFSTAASMQDS